MSISAMSGPAPVCSVSMSPSQLKVSLSSPSRGSAGECVLVLLILASLYLSATSGALQGIPCVKFLGHIMVIVNDHMTGIVPNNDSHHVTSCKCGWMAGGPGILHRGSLVICCISQMNIKSKVKYLDGFQYHAPAVFMFPSSWWVVVTIPHRRGRGWVIIC